MGKPARGAHTATLTALPQDVLLHILDRLTPDQLAAYIQLCTFTAASAADPSIWASLARRHLGIAPALSHTLNAKELSRLATSLLSRWWLSTGSFVSGVPVHFRKGFTEVRARGGVERAIEGESGPSAYVFGGRHKDAAVPVSMPAVSMDFFLDAAGPFPMDGMTIRVVHAAEPDDTPARLPNHSHLPALSLGAPHFSSANSSSTEESHTDQASVTSESDAAVDVARVRVKLNSTTIHDSVTPHSFQFSVFDIPIAPELLLTRPRMNTLIIEYDRSSDAAYWLKEVFVVPCVLPMPHLSKEDLPILSTSPTPPSVVPCPHMQHHPPPTNPSTERSQSPPPQHARPDRGSVEHLSPNAVNYYPSETKSIGRHHKAAKLIKQAKKQKHVFHHNHYRSPRGHAPPSPRSRSSR